MAVEIKFVDHTTLKVVADTQILWDLSDSYTFIPKNAKWDPRVKKGLWDGKIRIFKRMTGEGPVGLLPDLLTWCQERGHECIVDPQYAEETARYKYDKAKLDKMLAAHGAPFTPYEKQYRAFQIAIENGRSILIAPTSAGKSYILFMLGAFYKWTKRRTLIVIHRTQIVKQLANDLSKIYDPNHLMKTASIYDAPDVVADADVVVTTWQSIYEKPKSWFKQFDVLLGDEIHAFKAESLKQIVEKCSHIPIRHGVTATLDNDSAADRLVVQGSFSAPHRIDTVRDMIDRGESSGVQITLVKVHHNNEARKTISKFVKDLEWRKEASFLANNEARIALVKRIAEGLSGNTLIVFSTEEMGKRAFEVIEREKFFVNHTVSVDDRLQFVANMEARDGIIGVVSLRTFSEGISINNLHNIILIDSTKSEIAVPQLIGRGLRQHESKTHVKYIDIGDYAPYGDRDNFYWRHFLKRVEVYQKEGHPMRMMEYHL